jgi:hypothetical protein
MGAVRQITSSRIKTLIYVKSGKAGHVEQTSAPRSQIALKKISSAGIATRFRKYALLADIVKNQEVL